MGEPQRLSGLVHYQTVTLLLIRTRGGGTSIVDVRREIDDGVATEPVRFTEAATLSKPCAGAGCARRGIRLEQFPGMIDCLSSILDTSARGD